MSKNKRVIAGIGKATGNKYVVWKNLFDDWCVRVNDEKIHSFGESEKDKANAFEFAKNIEKGEIIWD